MKFFVIGGILIAALAIFFLWYALTHLPEFTPQFWQVGLYSDRFDEELFIKRKVWGITGDHQVIVVSKSKTEEFKPDEEREYVFRGLSPLFYRFESDTLKLYVTHAAKVPPNFDSRIHIEQVVLSNTEMMSLMENHERKGLKMLR